MNRVLKRSALLSVGLLGTGCFATKMAQTAELLGEGNSETAISFNASQLANLGEASWATVPNLIPNVHYGIGLNDKMDFFGNFNAASTFLQSGVKFSVAKTESGTLSLLPSLGWAPLFFYSGIRFSLPAMYTHRVSPTFAVTLLGSASYQINSAGSSDSFEVIGVDPQGNEFGLGGGIGVEIKGRALYVRPSVSYTQFQTAFPQEGESTSWGLAQLTFTVGRTGGNTEAQLDRIEQKLDDLAQ